MARKAKKKSRSPRWKKKSKPSKRRVKRAKKRAASKRKKAKASPRKSVGTSTKSARRQSEPIPADPAGRVGIRRPSNQPKSPRRPEPRELAQAEPDARFDDPRRPENNAREHPDGSMPPMERKAGYRNTDEQF
jgi:hypothetical protein